MRRVVVVLALGFAVAGVLAFKASRAPACCAEGGRRPSPRRASWTWAPNKCVACLAMKPILAELRQEYEGIVRADFVDVGGSRGGATSTSSCVTASASRGR